jgi:large repetitive protein
MSFLGIGFSDMNGAFAAMALGVGILGIYLARRIGSGLRILVAISLSLAGLCVLPAARVAAAGGSTLFAQTFANNTVSSSYPVSVPSVPVGTNGACLTASGNSATGPVLSCPANNDANGSGKLRLTASSTSQVGGLFSATSVPTSQGIDATFNTYQYGGNGADGLGFVLAAVNPADPKSPTATGYTGGALGYTPFSLNSGLIDAYMGIGLDVYGNFSNSSYQGSGCTNPSYISTTGTVPGQVVVRGPGNGTVGYCAVNSSAKNTSSKALTLRATTRAASVVPVEVAINPTATSFTTASGISVAAGTYDVVFTPVGGSSTTLSGTLPTVPSGLYPSSSWTTSGGIPKQLAFGWVGSTGGLTDFHEVSNVNVVSFNQVPQLAVTQTAYSSASPGIGAPVTYTVTPSVSSSGASEPLPVSVSITMPSGVTPEGAYGSGWTCAAPSGQVITCTDSSTPFAAGSSLPAITMEGIVTASGVTASAIASGTVATASSTDGSPGFAGSAAAGTPPTAPAGITLSSTSGSVAGGNPVTVSGSNIAAATVIYVGTTSQQQAGTPSVLLPCATGQTSGCFTANGNGTLTIPSMPSVAAAATDTVTVVTNGIAGTASYTYTDKPGTPAAPTATAGATSATVTWTAPASNGSPITGYTVTPFLNGVAQTPVAYDASTTTRTLTGLTAGSSYTFTVAAVNAIGTGPASTQSTAVVPFTLPGAPTIGTAAAGDSAATVTWTAPASNGFSAITGYVVTPYIAGVAQTPQTFSSTATTQTVTGLTPGTSYTFRVAAVNAAGTGPASAASGAVTVNAGPSLTFAAPPAGEAGVAYSDQLTATGGTGTLTWSVSSGTLPPGLTLNSSTGLLSGTPTASGSYAFTVKVTDAFGASATQATTLTVVAAPSLANPAPPAGQAAVAYSDALAVNGGTGPFTWTVSGGSLPSGLSLNSAAGLISGTPTTAGLSTFTVRVTDANGKTATQTLSMTVTVGPLVISAAANASTAAQGGSLGYTVTITNTGSTAYSGVSYSIPLASLLDDGTYNNDAAATSGTVTLAGQTLTWTGDLAAGAAAALTFSTSVNNPYTGDGTLSFTVTSPTTGTNCPALSADPRCSVTVPVSALTIAQSAAPSAAAPGAVVRYTVTITNSGQVASSGATFTDPLAGVLDDAAYNGDAAATAGSASFTSPNLTWTGNLAIGATATITFSVTVNNPDTGNQVLAATITSASSGTNCPAGGTDARCTATVAVQVLTITSSASTSSTTPGSTVQYTVTVTNSGQAAYTGASISDSLAGVLDDATYNGDAAATSGSLSYASPNLGWTGNLAVGATATITFSATVKNPDTGDKALATAITSPTPGSNCPASGPAACSTSVTVLVPGLTITNAASTNVALPGSVVGYTVTIADTGQTSYAGISVADDLDGLLDDAAYNGDAAATAGAVSYASPVLTWTGSLSPGGSATVTFSVTVNNPDTGEAVLTTTATSAAVGSTCPTTATPAGCRTQVVVLTPGLTITSTAGGATTTPGATVSYTVTIANTGQTPYTGTSVADDLTGVLDDAAYNGDAAATAGSVTFANPSLTWTGSLNPGDSATVTFSVTVHNPDTGNKTLSSTVTSAAAGNNCPSGSADARCANTVTVASLAITNAASISTTTPGGVVRYTATFTNTGQAPYTGITIQSDIRDVLDDATPNSDQTATSGTLSLTSTGISWTGSIPVGAAVTVTGTVTVKSPDPGNKLMTSTVSTSAPGSNCPVGGTDPACTATVTVLVPGLTITNTPGTSVTTPGSVVGYTVTIADTGQTSYAGISVADDLDGLLDDAAYNGDAAATAGAVSYASPVLTWTGSVSPGGTVTMTFSVTVNNPDTGEAVLTTTATSAAVGSTCPTTATPAGCRTQVVVLTPQLTITSTADTVTAVPGMTVHYTVTIANTGQTPYTGATVADDLTGVLDDAAYNADVSATIGTVSFTSPDVTWTGSLNPGDSATVTFSVTVDNPDTGDKILASTVTSAAAGNNCASGSPDARCAPTVTVESAALLTITITSDVSSVSDGGLVNYTVTVNNAAATPYDGATFTDDLTGLLDDAAYNGDASATAGSVSFASPDLTWTGTLEAAATATITFSVTVHDPNTGNDIMVSSITSGSVGANCAPGNTDARCANSVPVAELVIASTAGAPTVLPGGRIDETTTITNTGQTPYFGISVVFGTINTAGQITDVGNETASSGTLSVGGTGAVWTGNVPVGATVTITGSILVADPWPGGGQVVQTSDQTTAPGSNCPAASTDPRCAMTVDVLIPGLTITKTASSSTTTPGSTVQYTVTVDNTGQTPYTGATVTDDLTRVLPDAAYNGDAAATTGTASYTSPDLTWTGDLAPGDTATITYSITINNPDNGDKHLVNTVVSTAQGSTCPPGGTDPACTAAVDDLIPELTITKTADAASAVPGSAVTYTVTVADSGQTSYSGAVVTDDLTGVLDAAAYDGDAVATAGAVSFASPVLTWTGDLAPGDTATITYSVTIDDPETGGTTLTNTATSTEAGSSCPSATTGGLCAVTTGVITGPLTVTAPDSADLGSGSPGTTVQAGLGTVQVTDGRGFGAGWTTDVSSSDFTAAGSGVVIPVGDASYVITNLAAATGPATFGFVPSTGLSGNPQGVVSASNVDGNTSVTWDPLIQVALPGGAIGGTYSGTIVHSVS